MKRKILSSVFFSCLSVVSFGDEQLLGYHTFNEVGDTLQLGKGDGSDSESVYHPDGSLQSQTDVMGFVHTPSYDSYGLVQ